MLSLQISHYLSYLKLCVIVDYKIITKKIEQAQKEHELLLQK